MAPKNMMDLVAGLHNGYNAEACAVMVTSHATTQDMVSQVTLDGEETGCVYHQLPTKYKETHDSLIMGLQI